MTSQEANSIPLGDILSHYGYEPSRRYGGYDMYRSPFRSDTSPSFKVFREENRWYDFWGRYVWQGGGSGHACGKLLLSAGHEGTRKDEDLPAAFHAFDTETGNGVRKVSGSCPNDRPEGHSRSEQASA